MFRKLAYIFFGLAIIITPIITGCDTSADRELNKAEKALDAALDVNADAYASEDYQAAEELLIEAADLANENRVQEARQMAIKAKLRAEDAERKAKERHRILQQEYDEIGR